MPHASLVGRWALTMTCFRNDYLSNHISNPFPIKTDNTGQEQLGGLPNTFSRASAKKDYALAAVTQKQRSLITFAGTGGRGTALLLNHAVCSGCHVNAKSSFH